MALASNNVRSVIGLFCKLLADNEMSDIRAETLRQAKFNRDVTTKMMWHVLYDVVRFLDKTPDACSHVSEAGIVAFVKERMQNWGYLSKSFAELPSSLAFGSREILMAMGWVIHTKQLFTEIIRRRTCPLHQDLLSFTQKIPIDVGANQQLQLHSDLPAKEKLQRQLLLCGRLKLKLRRLYTSQQELAQLREAIHKCTVGVSVQPELNHLTPLEVFLLRYPESLGKMMRILEEDNAKLRRLLEWKEKEHVFWEWMDSVLTLHIQERGEANDSRQGALFEEESVFLDTPVDIHKQICALRAHVRDFILSHEDKIEALEKLVLSKKVSPMGIQLANFHMEKELFGLSQQFSSYESGKFDIPLIKNSEDVEESPAHQQDSLSSSSELGNQRKGLSHQKYIPQTAQYVKACKESEISESVKRKISVLRDEVEKLERELKQIQINNLKRLQNVTEQDSTSICILPRHFKQFLS